MLLRAFPTQPLACLQVTNRDLSIAVLRKFLPQLAQELTDGTLKRKPKTLPPVKQEAAGQVSATCRRGKHPLFVSRICRRLRSLYTHRESWVQPG